MELALVRHALGDDAPECGVRDTVRRLRPDGWTSVCADSSASAVANAVGAGLGIPVAVEPVLSLSDVVARNPGAKVVALCDPEVMRAFIARVIDVPCDAVPIGPFGSVSRIRVSSRGIHSLMSLNETLHLHRTFSTKGGIE